MVGVVLLAQKRVINMVVGILRVGISLGDIFSLKQKRQVVKSIIEKLKNRFNVSVAEVDRQDERRYAVLGIACVSNSRQHVDSQLDTLLDFLESDGRFSVESIQKELY